MPRSTPDRPPAALLPAAILLSGCTLSSAPPLPAVLDIGTTAPEDVAVNGSTAYVSNIADGSVIRLDLNRAGAVSSFIPAAEGAYRSAWGLKVVADKNWLLVIQNQPYDFNPAHAKAGRLSAFDLTSGAKVRSWALPEGLVGNAVDLDAGGNIYLGDIGPAPRIVRIDPATDKITTWASGAPWKAGGFGLGGMAYSGSGFYVAHDNVLWYLAQNADGSAAAPQAVKIAGDPVIFADGLRWTGSGLIYAENDALVAGAHGVVYKVEFSSPTTATRTALQTGLRDPSGVETATVGGKTSLLVAESQLGYAFGVDQGEPSRPYQIKVFAR
jgi:hypothetical protein